MWMRNLIITFCYMVILNYYGTTETHAQVADSCDLEQKQCLEAYDNCAERANKVNQYLRSAKNIQAVQQYCLNDCDNALKVCYKFLDHCNEKLAPIVSSDINDLVREIKDKHLKVCHWEDTRCETVKFDCRSEASSCLSAAEDVRYSKSKNLSNLPEKIEDCQKVCTASSQACVNIIAMCHDRYSVPQEVEIKKFITLIQEQIKEVCKTAD